MYMQDNSNQTNILLESGTNELELLVFELADGVYGINISKVVEIAPAVFVTKLPNSDNVIEGVYNSRGEIVSVINLYQITHNTPLENEKSMFIVCNFNQMTVAFHVGRVRGIERISWEEIKAPPAVSSGSAHAKKYGLLTGIADIKDQLTMILDFERIVTEINQDAGLNVHELTTVEKTVEPVYSHKQIVVADDSPMLNKMIVDSLDEMGFKNIKSFKNGADAWNYIQTQREGIGKVTDRIACIVSDIEMPQMDGHHLTKRVKSDSVLKEIPVFLFSSLINEQMYAKGKAVGADEQFSKPQIAELVKALIQQVQS